MSAKLLLAQGSCRHECSFGACQALVQPRAARAFSLAGSMGQLLKATVLQLSVQSRVVDSSRLLSNYPMALLLHHLQAFGCLSTASAVPLMSLQARKPLHLSGRLLLAWASHCHQQAAVQPSRQVRMTQTGQQAHPLTLLA